MPFRLWTRVGKVPHALMRSFSLSPRRVSGLDTARGPALARPKYGHTIVYVAVAAASPPPTATDHVTCRLLEKFRLRRLGSAQPYNVRNINSTVYTT